TVMIPCSRAGSRGTFTAPRVVLERDDVSRRSRCIKRYGHRAGRGVLSDRVRYTITVEVKHIVSPVRQGKGGAEIARRDRLGDRKVVVAGWHRHLHPVEEHTGADLVDHPVLEAVLQAGQGLGRAILE